MASGSIPMWAYPKPEENPGIDHEHTIDVPQSLPFGITSLRSSRCTNRKYTEYPSWASYVAVAQCVGSLVTLFGEAGCLIASSTHHMFTDLSYMGLWAGLVGLPAGIVYFASSRRKAIDMIIISIIFAVCSAGFSFAAIVQSFNDSIVTCDPRNNKCKHAKEPLRIAQQVLVCSSAVTFLSSLCTLVILALVITKWNKTLNQETIEGSVNPSGQVDCSLDFESLSADDLSRSNQSGQSHVFLMEPPPYTPQEHIPPPSYHSEHQPTAGIRPISPSPSLPSYEPPSYTSREPEVML